MGLHYFSYPYIILEIKLLCISIFVCVIMHGVFELVSLCIIKDQEVD